MKLCEYRGQKVGWFQSSHPACVDRHESKEQERPAAVLPLPFNPRTEVLPFNPWTEVSADAIHIANRIVKHLWIIFALLPFVAALLLVLAGVIK
jgi:hypothetical protein